MKTPILCALVLAIACTSATDIQSQGSSLEDLVTVTVKGARGLFTSPSQIIGAPEGSAVVAENLVVPRPGVYETRRGYESLGDIFPGGFAPRSMVEFKGYLIGWAGAALAYNNQTGGGWIAYPGLYSAPYGLIKDETGAELPGRVRFHETGGCLYFTTSTGVYRLETPVGPPVLAGISQGLPSTAALTGSSGFLPGGLSVAYRETWSKRTPDGRIIEGAPSGRATIFNTITATGTITFSGSSGTTTQTINGAAPFSQPSGTDAARGDALAAAINISADSLILGKVTAVSNGAGVVTISAVSPGVDGNDITLAVTGTGVTRSGATLTGGGATRNVSRTIPIPKDLPPGSFLRVWRTESFPNATGPGEDYAQIHEKAVADMVVGATSYTFTDITPDAIRGDAAYFSANLGDGLIASKFRPPLSTDVTTFRDSTVYVGAKAPESLSMTLLSTDSIVAALLSNPGDGLVFIFSDGVREEYHATASDPPAPGFFTVYNDGTPSQNIARTVNSLVGAISTKASGRLLAFYTSDDNGTPGSFRVEARAFNTEEFIIRAIQRSSVWFPALRTEVLGNITGRASNVVSVTTLFAATLEPGQPITLVTSTSPVTYPVGTKTISSVPDANHFTYGDVGANTGTTASGSAFLTGVTDITSERQGGTSFIAWTPLGEPDAVPVLNYVRVGKDENPVLGATLLGNSLYLRKADGLYRLSGDTPATFSLDQVDTTVSFVAPYAAFTLGGNAYALTTEGLKVWTETGRPQPASVPVEAEIRDIVVKNRSALDLFAFAVNYESDRTMLLWLPSDPEDASATFAYRYNYLTEAWTTETTDAYSAFVSPTRDKLIVSSDEGGDVYVERKDRLPTDYAEADGSAIASHLVFSPQLGSDPSLGKHFNRTKYHLDPDAPVPTTVNVTFASDWTPETGSVTIAGIRVRGHTLETLVTANNRRGTRLYLGIEHATANEKLSILGYTVSFYEYAIGTL